MDYAFFFGKYGASARTKNMRSPPPQPGEPAKERAGKREHPLPAQSSIPREFIRLCPWEMEYLFAVARRVRVGVIETGRFNGGSCFLMACAAPDRPIYSIDIAPRDDELLRSLFAQEGVGANVDLIVGDSQRARYPQIGPVDLIFVDGDHTYEGCMNDLENWYDHLVPGGHIVVHDCYLGQWGVQDAVLDFMAQRPELKVMASPLVGPSYWTYPAGSLGHLMRGPATSIPVQQ